MSDNKTVGVLGFLVVGLILLGLFSAALTPPGQKLLNRINTELIQAEMTVKRYVRQRRKHPQIRKIAAELVSHITLNDSQSRLSSIFRFVADEIDYISDPTGIEHISDPIETLYVKAGDCDCKSLLLATLLESIGYRCFIIFVKPLVQIDTARVIKGGHVFVIVKSNPNYAKSDANTSSMMLYRNGVPSEYVVPLESTAKGGNVGWLSNDVKTAIREGRYIIVDPDSTVDQKLALKLV